MRPVTCQQHIGLWLLSHDGLLRMLAVLMLCVSTAVKGGLAMVGGYCNLLDKGSKQGREAWGAMTSDGIGVLCQDM